MSRPSPATHLKRLVILLAAALVIFLGLAYLLVPASWNFDMANWYRLDSLKDIASQPMAYGGIEDIGARQRNAACNDCHKDLLIEFRKKKHLQLSCESCHGALADHAAGKQKTAAAMVDKTTGHCLNCHENLINKPAGFPTFRLTEKYVKHIEFNAGKLPAGTTCLKCHNPHDPTP